MRRFGAGRDVVVGARLAFVVEEGNAGGCAGRRVGWRWAYSRRGSPRSSRRRLRGDTSVGEQWVSGCGVEVPLDGVEEVDVVTCKLLWR